MREQLVGLVVFLLEVFESSMRSLTIFTKIRTKCLLKGFT